MFGILVRSIIIKGKVLCGFKNGKNIFIEEIFD